MNKSFLEKVQMLTPKEAKREAIEVRASLSDGGAHGSDEFGYLALLQKRAVGLDVIPVTRLLHVQQASKHYEHLQAKGFHHVLVEMIGGRVSWERSN